MSEPTNTTSPPPGGLRYQIGLWFFIIGNAFTFGSAIVIPAVGLPLAWIPICVLAGELLAIGAIPIIGLKGFKALKNKMFSIFKLPPVETLKPVSRLQHLVGLCLFVISIVLPWIGAAFVFSWFQLVSSGTPTPDVWGIPFEEQLSTYLTFIIGGEICFLVGVFMLGGLWWERTRYLFVWPGRDWQHETE